MSDWDQFAPVSQVAPTAPAADPWAQFAPVSATATPAVAPADAPSVTGDVLKSGGIGLVKGAIGTAGLPGDARELLAKGVNKLSSAVGYELPQEKVSDALKYVPTLGTPTSQQLRGATETVTGPLYEPKSILGEYAQTVGEFAPALLTPGGVVRKVASTLIPAVASETAGQATKGTAAEPYARVGAALASPLLASAARRAITPLPASAVRQEAVDTLQAHGVDSLTAGQRTGSKPLQWFEQALGDIPGAGRATARAAETQGEEFTRAALRQTGTDARRATPEVVDNAFTRIGREFDRLETAYNPTIDRTMANRINHIADEYNSVVSPSNRVPVVERTVNDVFGYLANQGHVTGPQYKDLSSRLERARRGSTDPALKETLGDLRTALHDMMERHIQNVGTPSALADLGAWREARRQYRNMLVIEKAATGAGPEAAQGLISPPQLRNAVVTQNRRAYARGDGDFADLARAGESVMRTLPQSGTAPRSYAQHLPAAVFGTLGGVFGGVPGAAAAGAAAIAGPPVIGRAIMSRLMQNYLGNQRLAGTQGPGINAGMLSAILARPLPPVDPTLAIGQR